jgi:hypothetical protein
MKCSECNADFGQHFQHCSKFDTAWPYHGVFYNDMPDGAYASHPVAVFAMKEQAELYAKEYAENANWIIKPVKVLVEP